MFKEMIKPNNILVVGDFMLDSYWHGSVSRISPEAPVAVFQKKADWSVLGGAANVVANLIAAGKGVVAVSVIGHDAIGDELKILLENIGCDCSLLHQSDRRCTTRKTRLLAQNNQQLLRIDEEKFAWITGEEEEYLIQGIENQINKVSGIVISDYMKGVLTKTLCQKIINIARYHNIPVFCDIKDPEAEKYSGATLIKPNRKELGVLSGMSTETEDEIKTACWKLCKRCDSKYLLVTLGAQGMALYKSGNDDIEFIPSEPRDVFDVSGAGDTVISYLAACISSGIGINDAVRYANQAAGIKVGKVGTGTVTLEEMEQDSRKEKILGLIHKGQETKLLTLKELLNVLHNHGKKKVVFTNGCFDILHAGHVMYLQKAAELGDVLVVGVNSDNSVRRLKGLGRPVNDESDRLAVLSGLQSISYLVLFDEDTPEELVRSIKPDVLVKGADYKGKFIAGADFVKKCGGEVVLIPMLESHSTTKIIRKSEKI